ncbi:MAG: tRNA pseudouridine(38-40) synthase TruA [Candidatus Aminicenantes bacterium]|nr:tRNA pseudouridine(38-40) synthase TruA [Candidatus Aminicenantes bacterium]
MPTYKLILSYDGTDFHGWQRQREERTVQGVVEGALEKITGQKISLVGAGRTDAGVHARGQVAHFRAHVTLDEEELHRALNAILPWDVRIVSLRRVSDHFHARRSAFSKIYEYRLLNSNRVSPFLFRYVLPWPYPLDFEKMEQAAKLFLREADFSAFTPAPTSSPVRRIYRSELKKRGSLIIYRIEADGFLRYMVRTIVGTLLEVGRGRLNPQEIEKFFGPEIIKAGPVAPAKGLCLVRVLYEPRSSIITKASSMGFE